VSKIYRLYGALVLSATKEKKDAMGSGVGKCMVALCYKISLDSGSDGYILFEAKNRLIPYYQRLGAKRIGSSSRMYLDEAAAQKLINLYF
jgi:hypothetical protein